mmetsp:Transcript_8186/g.29638  ORF Transcript_8186/g.29638 Transcript_8186/m.29638 type:complete len:232 (+) Transcript_8186:331-1026(+)
MAALPATSSGRSRSSISQPPSPSSRSSSSSSLTTSKSPSACGMSRSRSSPQAPPSPSSPCISIILSSVPFDVRLSALKPSNIVFVTCSSGQFSSLKIGVGGSMRVPFPFVLGIGISCSVRITAISSAASSSPWVFAVIYARGSWPTSCRIFTLSLTSPRYRELWNCPMMSFLISAIFTIFFNLSMWPVMRYKKDSRSKFLHFWYANSTISKFPCLKASTPRWCHVSLSSSS